jgi:hypothetical protein
MKRLTVLGLILSVCSSAGCLFGSTTTAPTNYTIVSPVSEIFQGTLDPKGTQYYNITVGNPDPLRITLASVTDPASGAALSTKLKLGLGVTDGTTCTSTFETTSAPSLTSQYFQVATANTYCIYVADPGTLTSTVGFAVRIIHS